MTETVGHWLEDEYGLPCFAYTGALPAVADTPDGTAALMPDDPFFILGNYRLTVFSHCSGRYQFMTGERGWGRLNQGHMPDSGDNSAVLNVDGCKFELTDMQNQEAIDAEKFFGVGFAAYEYNCGGKVRCRRRLSVKPSSRINTGISAMLVTVTLENLTDSTLKLDFCENISANYQMAFQQRLSEQQRKVAYECKIERKERVVCAEFTARYNDPLLCRNAVSASKYDCFPPSLFMYSADPKIKLSASGKMLNASCSVELKSFAFVELEVVVGYCFDDDAEKISEELLDGKVVLKAELPGSSFGKEWRDKLPVLEECKDDELRLEMRWHAYCLEAMANYNSFFDETYIPQGTTYAYDSGTPSSARDHMQHALPLLYTNPELAESVLRLIMKKTTQYGEIRLAEQGHGMTTNQFFYTSDQQLYFMHLLAEYIKITGNKAFLEEVVPYYPLESGARGTVLEHLERCFVFLRDEVDRGENGLVRLLNSDWNDAVYFYVKELPYGYVYSLAESHLNTAMAVKVCGDLLEGIQGCDSQLEKSMELYREELLDALRNELADRDFLARFYISERKAYGVDNLFLEPQCFALQIPEISQDKRIVMWQAVKERVLQGEKLGARQIETPLSDDFLKSGSRENGGVWYALNGQLVLGLVNTAPAEAGKIFRRMTLKNHAEAFPGYWVGYWSAPDNMDSSLLNSAGLPDQQGTWHEFPVFCGHAHAWPLFCYFKLKERDLI